jgi:hypothetical protein
MLRHMRTTVRLDDQLLTQAKRIAATRGETLTSLIEKGLRLALAQPVRRHKTNAVHLPVCRKGGGTLPGIDLGNSADLLDRMDSSS